MAYRMSIDHITDEVQGLLSNTIVPGSRAHAILPASIRHSSIQDVLFVYNNHIVVKQYLRGKLHTVLTKDDLDSTVYAARLLGAGRRLSDSNSTLVSSKSQLNEQVYGAQPASPRHDFLAQEPKTGVDRDGDTTMTTDLNEPPPQILVVTLKRGNRDSIAFIYASQVAGCEDWSRFGLSQVQRPLPSSPDDRESLRYGRHLAIDAESRVVAVAANERNLLLYRLRKGRGWLSDGNHASDGRMKSPCDPIVEERRIIVNGTIRQMEFLTSPESDPDLVILLLIVTKRRSVVMQRWDWDSCKSLADGLSVEWRDGHPLEPSLQNCQLLMPLSTEPGFVVFASHDIARFTDLLAGSPKIAHLSLPRSQRIGSGLGDFRANDGGTEALFTRWTAWAKPVRRDDFNLRNDHFYLGREDGTLLFCELSRGSTTLFATTIELDITNVYLFAVLDSDNGGYELLVTSTGLFRIPVQSKPECEQLFLDWSPLQDFDFIDDGPSKASLVVCSTHRKGVHSKNVHRILHAYNARCEEISLPNEYFAGPPPRDFLLPTESGKCLVSSREGTALYSIASSSDGQAEEDAKPDPRLCEIFDVERYTLLAGCTPTGILLQVTRDSIRASAPGCTPRIYSFSTSGADIVNADLDSTHGDLVLALRKGASFYLQHVRIRSEGLRTVFEPEREEIFVDAAKILNEPTSICVTRSTTNGNSWAAVGTWQHELLLVKIRSSGYLEVTHKLVQESLVFESLRIVENYSDTEGHLREVVAGLRDGKVERYAIDTDERLNKRYSTCLGSGAVTVDVFSRSVIAFCDGKLFRAPIETDSQYKRRQQQRQQSPQQRELGFHEIVLSDSYGYGRPRLEALAKIAVCPTTAAAQNCPILIQTDGRPLMVYLEPDCKGKATIANAVAEPQNFFEHDGGPSSFSRSFHTPSRMLSTSYGLVIAYLEEVYYKDRRTESHAGNDLGGRNSQERHNSANGSSTSPSPQGRRQVFSRLGILNSDRVLNDGRDSDTDIVVGSCSGEFVCDMMEWKVETPRAAVKLIAVCTKRRRKINGSNTGRLYLYGLNKDLNSDQELFEFFKIKFPDPVYTACQLNGTSFIVCSGSNVSMIELCQRGDKKVEFPISRSAELQSPGRHIEVRKVRSDRPLIYIATEDSVEILDFDLKYVSHGPGYFQNKGWIHVAEGSQPLIALPTDGAVRILRADVDAKLDERLLAPIDGGFQISRDTMREVIEARLLGTVTRIKDHPNKKGVMIGAGILGDFYQLRIIGESQWRLLKFLQNVCEQDSRICPLTYAEKRRQPRLNPVWRPSVPKTELHVNGDILDRALRGGDEGLARLMRNALPGELDNLDTVQRRFTRFEAYAYDARVITRTNTPVAETIAAVSDWVRELLWHGF